MIDIIKKLKQINWSKTNKTALAKQYGISRQRLTQINYKLNNKCLICGGPLKTKNHCQFHARRQSESTVRYYYRNKERKKEYNKKYYDNQKLNILRQIKSILMA